MQANKLAPELATHWLISKYSFKTGNHCSAKIVLQSLEVVSL